VKTSCPEAQCHNRPMRFILFSFFFFSGFFYGTGPNG